MGLGSLGLDPTPITGTDPNEATNRINLHTHTGNPGEGDQIDSVNVINTPAGDITADNTQAAINELNVLANLGRTHVPVRQTVLSGLTDILTGLPIYLISTSGFSVNILALTTPLIIAFAYNFDPIFGQLDYIGSITEDVPSAWSALPANQTCYLYVNRNIETGVLSYGYSLLAPVYEKLPPGTPTADQHWFDLNTFYMKRWSGTAWDVKQRVFVGECTTDASSVTSVICYAIQGKYDSGWFAVGANQEYSKNYNIGRSLDDLIVYGWIRTDSTKKKRVINNLSSGGYNGLAGNDAGDILAVLDNSVYLRTAVKLHPSYATGVNDTSRYPDVDAGSGQARIFVKRGF
jgi:hypothetical protein